MKTTTIPKLREKIQLNNRLIKGIERNPQMFVEWKITDLKNKNSIIAAQIKEMRHLYQ